MSVSVIMLKSVPKYQMLMKQYLTKLKLQKQIITSFSPSYQPPYLHP